MLTEDKYIQLIKEVSQLDSPSGIMEGLGDICYDAEMHLEAGDLALARKIFSEIIQLDEYNDYYSHARSVARKGLIATGDIVLPSLDGVLKSILESSEAPEQQRLILAAKTLMRDHKDREGAAELACDCLVKAGAICPLSKKDLRFKLEVERGL